MKTIKKDLPEGVKKMFIVKIGKKVRVINKKYCKKNKKVTDK